MGVLTVKNPYSGAVLGEVPSPDDGAVIQTLVAAGKAFTRWRESTSAERSQLLAAVSKKIAAEKPQLAALMSAEAGKPIKFAEAEVDRAVGVFDWAAGEAVRFGGEVLRLDTTKTGRPGHGLVTRFPRGVILGITPFNFPLNLVAHKVAPALATGNVIVVKPSPATPLTALRLAEIVGECGGAGLMTVVMASDAQTAKLTAAPEVAMVSFTGSARVGWLVREQAPRKPVTLELGGNAWCLVAGDVPEADLPGIARRVTATGYGYAGQSCISVQNVACDAALWPRFREHLAEATQATAYGDPASDAVVCGPVINDAASKRIPAEIAKGGGKRTVTSEKAVGAPGSALLLKPTYVEEPDLGSSLVREEIFGPVVTARPYKAFDEVLGWVNGSHYGLQTGIYTNDYALIDQAYRELEVGGVIINDAPTTRYDHQPYGGVKDSGFGREGLAVAMEEMTEPKFLALSAKRVLG